MIFRKFENIFGRFNMKSLDTYTSEGSTLFNSLVTRHAYLSYKETICQDPARFTKEKNEIENLWKKFLKTSGFTPERWNLKEQSRRECDIMVSDHFFETERANQDGFMGRRVAR